MQDLVSIRRSPRSRRRGDVDDEHHPTCAAPSCGRSRHAEVRRGRPGDARAHRGRVRAGPCTAWLARTTTSACRTRRWRGAARGGSLARHHDGLARRQAHRVPRGRHRAPGGLRHRQRPRGDGRHGAARPHLRRSSSRRASRGRTSNGSRQSLRAACAEAGTTCILTGDTKVMGRGEIDGVVFNTCGIGWTARPDHRPWASGRET